MPRHAADPDLAYIASLYAPEDALLRTIDAELKRLNRAIHVSAVEGRLLQWLVRAQGVRSIVEIGTLAGYSTLWMAGGLPEDGRIVTIDKDISLAERYISRSPHADKITLLEGNAPERLNGLTGRYDMVFIDADKIAYPAYLDWAETHIRRGGLIAADNTLLFGAAAQDSAPEDVAPATWEAMRRFNARLADRGRYDAMMIPTADGLSLAVKLF